ncbi:hypothetical protein ACU8KH_01699 [Lachancea thermotolerans]
MTATMRQGGKKTDEGTSPRLQNRNCLHFAFTEPYKASSIHTLIIHCFIGIITQQSYFVYSHQTM